MSKPVGIVTGGASGIGLAVVKHLLSKGWRVAIADINQSQGDILAAELGENVLFVKTDVSQWSEQAYLFKLVFEWGGNRIDFLAANAGVADTQSLYQLPENGSGPLAPLNTLALNIDLEAVIQGIWIFLHYARQNKEPGGKVVITSSAAGLYPMETCPQYAAAKHALVGLTRSCVPLLAQQNVTINCICPAFVPTNLAPPGLLNVWPAEHITPMSTVLRAYDTFMTDGAMTGQTVELSQGELYFRQKPSFANESQRWIAEDSAALWEKAYPRDG